MGGIGLRNAERYNGLANPCHLDNFLKQVMESVTSGRKAAGRFAGITWLTASLLGMAVPVMAQQGGGLDFRLPPADDGRDSNVQGPSDNGLPPAAPKATLPEPAPKIVPPAPLVIPPAPKATTSVPKSATPAPTAAPAPAPKAATPAPAPKAAVPQAATPSQSAPEAIPPAATGGGLMDTDVITPPSRDPLPLPNVISDEAEELDRALGAEDGDAAQPAAEMPADAPSGDMPWWAWALAAALGLAAGLIYWRRQGQAEEKAVDQAKEKAERKPASVPPAPERPKAPVEPVKAPPQPISGAAARAPKPAPAAAPPPVRPPVLNQDRAAIPANPVTTPPPPAPSAPSAAPSPQAAAGYVQAKPLVRRAAAEVRADVHMDVAVRSIRVEEDHVAVGFLLTLSNHGSLAATGLMVRIALGQGAAMNEAVLGRFYDGAGGSVLRDDIDLPAGRSEQLSSEVKLPRSSIEPLMMGGKPMMVPVLAADVTYHWDGPGDAFGQMAAAYVLGRASVSGSDKLAPISLAQTPMAVDRPAARITAMARRQ